MGEKIAWCGVGSLGRPIVERLIDAGHVPILYDVRDGATDGFGDNASTAATPADAARRADKIFSTIPDDAALEALALGPDGLTAGLAPGSIYCDLSTVSPASSAKVASACEAVGAVYLRAAISGSVMLAETGKLTLLASGPRSAYDRCTPVFAAFSVAQFYTGAGEEARVLKLLINNIAAVTAAGVAESIAYGRKSGVDYDTILDIIEGSVIASPLIRYKIDPLRRRDFTANFTTQLMLKDIRILGESSALAGCEMPMGTAVQAVFEDQVGAGHADEDFFSCVKMMEARAGLDDS